MKKINAFLMLVLAMMTWNFARAQVTTIFTETMGSVSATTTIAAHETANGFDNDGYTMSGTADLRNNTNSTGYTGASGVANVFITSTVDRFFMIEGINTTGYTSLSLSLGHHKSTTTGNNELAIEVSSDGNNWAALTYSRPTGAGTANWRLIEPTGTIPATANLRIRFRQTSSTIQFRIDDIKLTGTLSASPTLSVSSLTDFGTQCTGGTYGPNSFTVTGSNLTGNVSLAALEGFAYSLTSGGAYTSTLSLTPSSGSLDQEVFVRFSPTLAQSYSGNIVVSGGGATSVNRSVTGIGTGAVSAVVSSSAANSIGNTTATLNANLSTLGTCPSTTEKGFVYSLTSANATPIVGGSGVTKVEVAGIATGTYSHALSSLSGNSGYSFRAYVYNGSTYTYGDVLTFSTTSPATKLAFGTSPPVTAFVNSNLTSFTLEAQRSDNSLDTEFNGNITIAKASGSGAISGTLTVAAVSGVATFSNIQFDAIDTYTISASAAGLTGVTSGNVVVSALPETIAAWNFNGQSSPATFAATTYNANLVNASSQSNITRGAGATSSAGSNSFRTTGFQNNGISTANTDYFQVTLSPANGFELSLSTIDAFFAGTATFYGNPGVTSQFAYSLDGTNFTLIGSSVTSTSLTLEQINLSGISQLQNIAVGTTVTLRYYASGQTTTGGWGFSSPNASTDGLKIGGYIQAGLAVPEITVSETTLNNFAYIFGEGPSAQQSFTVGGTNLTNNMVITAPASYEISTIAGAGFTATSPITITPSSGNVNQEIYIRLKTNLTVGDYDGQSIQVESNGADSKSVTLNGDVFTTNPTTQASNIVFSSVGSNSINLTWTSGNGVNRIVKMNTSNSFTNPVNGNNYVANAVYAGGEQTIYNNNGNSVTVTDLNPSTTYWFRVYEYNNTGTFTRYMVSTATNNPLSTTTTDAPWEDFETTNTKTSYVAGNVICKAGSWNMTDALLGTSASDRKNGLKSVRVQNVGFIQTNFDIADGIGIVNVAHARYGSDAVASWVLKVSNDGGTTWTAFVSDPVESSTTTLETATFNVNVPGNVRLRLEKLSGGNRLSWDDIYITNYSPTSIEWTGASSTNWSTPGNWNPASVPDATKDVEIPNVANKPIIGTGTDALAKNITLASGATLTINQGGTLTVAQDLSNNGTITVKSTAAGDGSLITNTISGSGSYKIERFLAASKWHLISSPITNAMSGIFAGIWLRPYNETTNAFGAYITPTNIPLTVGQGFSNWTNNNEVRTFSGTVNNGAIGPINLPRTNLGWNLIGNPYPSAINWDAASGWNKNNVANSVYVWNNNQYATYINGLGANGGSEFIPMGQGFFVQALSGGGTISMNNNVRVHNSVAFMKNSDPANIIRVKVATENNADESVIAIRSGVMDEFDYQFDATKLRGDASAPQLYTKKAETEAVICAYSDLFKVFGQFVYFEPAEYTEHVLIYTHTIDEPGVPVLFDHITGATIYPNVPYTFTPSTQNLNKRFEFIKASTTGIQENSSADVMVWQSDKKLHIHNLGNEILKEVNVYDMQGRLVFVGNQHISSLSHLTTAPYVVHVVTNQQTIIRKIVLR